MKQPLICLDKSNIFIFSVDYWKKPAMHYRSGTKKAKGQNWSRFTDVLFLNMVKYMISLQNDLIIQKSSCMFCTLSLDSMTCFVPTCSRPEKEDILLK